MQRAQWQALAISAGLSAFVIAIITGRLPRWLRVTLVFGILILGCGGGFFAYRYATHPTTLTVAVGSVDGSAAQLMSTIATRLASIGAPVRLKVLDEGTALDAIKAFSAGKTDLAVARADIGDLSSAETVVVVTRGVLLLVAPPGSSITEMDDIKGKTIGVIGGEVNQQVVAALTKEYGLDSAKTRFKDLTLTANSTSAQIQAGGRSAHRDAADRKILDDAARFISKN